MRGENPANLGVQTFHLGTSPRARGKRSLENLSLSILWNIPACAGKTLLHLVGTAKSQEHPRVRGENNDFASARKTGPGTSPRARGKHCQGWSEDERAGNIPACAGKTLSPLSFSCLIWEHPRVRGENRRLSRRPRQQSGTSPRARGKLRRGDQRLVGHRNIPACAGKTQEDYSCYVLRQEHPRVRGENVPLLFLVYMGGGTSPRARGKPGGVSGL